MESVGFGAYPVTFYRDLVRGHCGKFVIEGNVIESNLCEACLWEKASFMGIVTNEEQKMFLEDRILEIVKKMMRTKGSPLENRRYMVAMKVINDSEALNDGDESQLSQTSPVKPNAKAKAKAKAKPKAKAKVSAKASADPGAFSDDEQADEDEEEDEEEDQDWAPGDDDGDA